MCILFLDNFSGDIDLFFNLTSMIPCAIFSAKEISHPEASECIEWVSVFFRSGAPKSNDFFLAKSLPW